jgi:hypothetical protein
MVAGMDPAWSGVGGWFWSASSNAELCWSCTPPAPQLTSQVLLDYCTWIVIVVHSLLIIMLSLKSLYLILSLIFICFIIVINIWNYTRQLNSSVISVSIYGKGLSTCIFVPWEYIVVLCFASGFMRKCRSNSNLYYMAPNVGLISNGIDSPITKITENIGD